MTRNQLVKSIQQSFSGICRPDDKYITLNKGDDIWVESFLGGSENSWTEINSNKIEHENSVLSCVRPQAYAYYLAAYLTWSLKNYETSESTTVDNIIYSLNSCSYDSITKLRLEKNYKTLNLIQSKSVLNYLKYMASLSNEIVESEAAQKAIDCYWHKYA